jgi:biopolymer transport protein ExbD
VVSDWDGQQIIERLLAPEDIEALLRARAGRAGRGEELRCVVRADRDVQYQHVEMVLRACGRARIAKIVFAANKGPAPARPDGGEE